MKDAGVPTLKVTPPSKRESQQDAFLQPKQHFALNVLVKKEKATKERHSKDANFKRNKERKAKWHKRAMTAMRTQRHAKSALKKEHRRKAFDAFRSKQKRENKRKKERQLKTLAS